MSVSLVRPGLRASVLRGEDLPAWLQKHSRSDYIIAVVLSAPPWVDRAALLRLQKRARELTRVTGVKHVLDHIVPVCHPYVCGLTVPWNIRVIPATANAAKGNQFSPDQLEVFAEPEQFSLWVIAP